MDAPLLLVNGEGAALVAENGDYVAVREHEIEGGKEGEKLNFEVCLTRLLS